MAGEIIREFAPAKINLFLHVGEKRSDGFHAVQSLVAFADVGDVLAFDRSDGFLLMLEGPFARELEGDAENLVLKAARLLAAVTSAPQGATMVLAKNLPVASGIGGGSADAAATLRGLERLWQLRLSDSVRGRIAASLGSDVPACLTSQPLWMEGRGEHVSPAAELPPLSTVLVNPGVAVPTPEVFASLRTRRGVEGPKPGQWSSVAELILFLDTTTNDLETPARALAPEIGDVLDVLANCPNVLLSRMSGSGATCFGLFDDRTAADAAAKRIKDHYPDWWVAAAQLMAGNGTS
jgi:4-diphosphocytidyl-2-C-methyl-D-erythritol kinase